MKKKLAILTAAVLGASLMSGCGGNGGGQSASADGEVKSIRLMV